MAGIQYTVRGVPPKLDERLREEARTTGKSLNTVVVETLEQAKLATTDAHDDLDWFIGAAPDGAQHDEEDAQAWLDSMPNEPG